MRKVSLVSGGKAFVMDRKKLLFIPSNENIFVRSIDVGFCENCRFVQRARTDEKKVQDIEDCEDKHSFK